MASKEATVYIIDVGLTMGEKSQGRQQTNLEWALQYVWDRITTTIATGRKTAMVGVVGLRTDGTVNMLEEELDYHHISILQPIAQILMPQLRKLREQLKVSSTESGDATSALVIAIQMITEQCKKLQYIRRIVLVTDARAPMHTDDLSQITKKLKEDKIELLIAGVDFDDAGYGFKEESKASLKRENEIALKALCENCDGTFGTLAQAVDELETPRTKTTKPVPSFKGFLTLGNPDQFDTALSINIERYPKTMVASAPSASSFVLRNSMAANDAPEESEPVANGDGLVEVRNARTYQIVDENAPGGKRDLERDDLAKGYEYGRTAVHISESDQNVTTYETRESFDIVGFVDKTKYDRYLDMSRASLIVSQRTNDKASMALSSLVHALYELEAYAIARLVPKENREPKMLLVGPHIEEDFECLLDVELPFAEDVRSYKFPPLDRVVTVSGKELKVHRNLPSDDLQEAMQRYVAKMDLSEFAVDEDGHPAEYMPMDETFSPKLHRINQVIKYRAVFPDAEPPPPSEIILKYSNPPQGLVEQAQRALADVVQAADVKRVPPKARGKRFGRKEAPKPLSDLDVNALLAKDPTRKQKRVDPKNAIPEFKQLLGDAEKVEELYEACNQLKFIIYDWVRHSVGESNYGRIVEGARVMREEMIELEEPKPFNYFLRDLKQKIFAGELGGDRKELWYRIRVNRVGLIQSRESEGSEVTEAEAKEFMLPRA